MQLPGRFQVFRQESQGNDESNGNDGGRGCEGIQNPGLQNEEEVGRGILSSEDHRNMITDTFWRNIITTLDLALLFQDVTKIPFKVLYQDCRKDNEVIHMKLMWTALCRFFKRSYPQIARTIRKDHSTCVWYYKRHKKMMKEEQWYSEGFLLLFDEVLDRLGA